MGQRWRNHRDDVIMMTCNVFKAHRVPIDDVNVVAERAVDVLRGIQVEEITVVVIKIDPCIHVLRYNAITMGTRTWYNEHVRMYGLTVVDVHVHEHMHDIVLLHVPASSLMKTVGLVIISSQCSPLVGLKSRAV